MDDIVSECKKKMARFRIQEFKEVLSQIGLPKMGRKQDLMERILALLSGGEDTHGPQKNKSIPTEDVARIIDETYRKMQHTGANDPLTAGHSGSESSVITPKEEIMDQKVRCLCCRSRQTEFMIKCADPHCQVFQHISCVIIPVESTERVLAGPSQHYCELCRISRCDPFWKTLAQPLHPVKLLVPSLPDDGSQPLQFAETSFQITKADVRLLANGGYDVQAWCILLNDSVTFRMQWPHYPDLRINDIPVKTINRPGSKMLGANGRDDSPSISVFLLEGWNKIYFSCSDARTFCIGIRLVQQRTVQQVINLIPTELEGESFSEAVARVCRCIGGGASAANDDSDSDLEVITDNVTINLRCPMSGCRMKTAARFKGCIHLGCFDLHTFVEINQRSRKWQCPICLKNYSLEDIIIDPYLNRIVKMLQPCDEDVTEIEVKSNGFWRAKISHPFEDLERWHLPEGFLCNVDSETEVPTENGHGGSDVGLSQGSQSEEHFINCGEEIISTSSDDSENMPCNYNQTSGITNRSSSSSLGGPSLIVLSDSEEENNNTVSATGGSNPANPESPDMELEDDEFPAASPRPSGEAERSQMSNSKGSGETFSFPSQARSVSGDMKTESSQTSNIDGPFTFPRQPRTIRRPNVAKDVPGD